MNGFGKVGRSVRSHRGSHRSVSIFEAIRFARIMMGESGNVKSRTTILQKDWQRNDKNK